MSGGQLANGRRSVGFVAVELEAADSRASNEALGLAVRFRVESDRRQTDGILDDREVAAVAAMHGITRPRLAALLLELVAAGLVERIEGGVRDLNFLCWCNSRAELQAKRDGAARRQKEYRDRVASREGDTPRDADVTRNGDGHVTHNGGAPSHALISSHHISSQHITPQSPREGLGRGPGEPLRDVFRNPRPVRASVVRGIGEPEDERAGEDEGEW